MTAQQPYPFVEIFCDPQLKSEGENSPIGIILCSGKGREKIELLFSPGDNINVSEYLTNLPSKGLLAEKLSKAVKSAQLKLPGSID